MNLINVFTRTIAFLYLRRSNVKGYGSTMLDSILRAADEDNSFITLESLQVLERRLNLDRRSPDVTECENILLKSVP